MRGTQLAPWLYSGVGLGIVVSGAVAHVLAGPGAWRGAWLARGIIAAATIYPAWRWLLGDTDEVTAAPHGRAVRMPPLTVPLALLVAAYTLEGGGYIVTGTFLVAIVDRTPGLTGLGADVWMLVGLAVVPCTPLWSAVARRIGYMPALILAYVLQGCAIVLPVLGTGAAVAFVAAIPFGGTFMGLAALTMTLARFVAPVGLTGVIGLLTLGFSVGQIVAPALAGMAARSSHSFRPALFAATAAVLLAGALMAALGRYRRVALLIELEEAR